MSETKLRFFATTIGWFDANFEVELVDDYQSFMEAGLFRGLRNWQVDEEICSLDEFVIIEDDDVYYKPST